MCFLEALSHVIKIKIAHGVKRVHLINLPCGGKNGLGSYCLRELDVWLRKKPEDLGIYICIKISSELSALIKGAMIAD